MTRTPGPKRTFHLTTAQVRLLGDLADWAKENLSGTPICLPLAADYMSQWSAFVAEDDRRKEHAVVMEDASYWAINGWLTRYASEHGREACVSRFGPVERLDEYRKPRG